MDPTQQNSNPLSINSQSVPVIPGYYVMPTQVPAPYYDVAPTDNGNLHKVTKNIKLQIVNPNQPTLHPQQFYIPQNPNQAQYYVPQVCIKKNFN
jgi:hypothetical protein